MKINEIKRLPSTRLTTVTWVGLENYLKRLGGAYGVDISPSYQRGYIWTSGQQTDYIEWVLRGGITGKDIFFAESPSGAIEVVDGKQRLQAVRNFMGGLIKAFDQYIYDYPDKEELSSLSPPYNNAFFNVHIAHFEHQHHAMRWYIDLNKGLTKHDPNELENVERMINEF